MAPRRSRVRFPSWPGADASSTLRPKIPLQSQPFALRIASSRLHDADNDPPPPFGSPRRTGSVLRQLAELSRLPFGGCAGLDSSAAAAVSKGCADGESSRLWKEQRTTHPPPRPSGGILRGPTASQVPRPGHPPRLDGHLGRPPPPVLTRVCHPATARLRLDPSRRWRVGQDGGSSLSVKGRATAEPAHDQPP